MRIRPHHIALGALGAVSPAQALDTVQCTEAHFAAQVARAEGRLLEAEEELSRCGDPSCPGVLTQECGTWLEEVRREVPSIVLVVQDSEERDVLEFDVEIDGQAQPLHRTGAVRLNPGKHEIVVTAEGHLERRQLIRLRVGEQKRRVRLLMSDAEPQETVRPAPVWPLIASGAVTIAGGAGFAYFGATARGSERDLGECRPDCDESQVSVVRTRYVAANVSLAVGLTALAAGGVYFLVRPREPDGPAVSLTLDRGAPLLGMSGTF